MKTVLGKKNRIRLPEETVRALGLERHDRLEVTQMNGTIVLLPLRAYPRDALRDIRTEIDLLKEGIGKGKAPDFGALEQLLAMLEEE